MEGKVKASCLFGVFLLFFPLLAKGLAVGLTVDGSGFFSVQALEKPKFVEVRGVVKRFNNFVADGNFSFYVLAPNGASKETLSSFDFNWSSGPESFSGLIRLVKPLSEFNEGGGYGKWLFKRGFESSIFAEGHLLIENGTFTLRFEVGSSDVISGEVTYENVVRFPFSYEPDIRVPQDYPTIQEAIDAASEGDVIFVSSGVYYENIVIDKPLVLIGENMNTTVIDGNHAGDVVRVESANVTIQGFTIQGSGINGGGIHFTGLMVRVQIELNIINNFIGVIDESSSEGERCLLIDSVVANNGIGVKLSNTSNMALLLNKFCNNAYDVYAEEVTDLVVMGNTFHGDVGMSLSDCSEIEVGYNTFALGSDGLEGDKEQVENINIVGNTFRNLTGDGIRLQNVTKTVIASNNITNIGEDGIHIETKPGESLAVVIIVIIALNDISNCGKAAIFANRSSGRGSCALESIGNNIRNATYGLFANNSSGRGSCALESVGNNVTGTEYAFYFNITGDGNTTIRCNKNNIGNATYGLFANRSSGRGSCALESIGNNIRNATYAIQLVNLNGSIIKRNKISENMVGIILQNCTENRIYHNNFVDNQLQTRLYNSPDNIWDGGYPSGGNYWSDYTGADLYSGSYQDGPGSDGIGDTPYIIDENNVDNYPLIYPYGYTPTPDINQDGIVDIYDLILIASAYGSRPGSPEWNPYADLNQDGIIDIYDLIIIASHYGQVA